MADDSLVDLSSVEISKLKVPDLKKELKMRGLTTSGNKTELMERLQKAFKSNTGNESVDDLEEDLLNDDDDEHLDASESIILDNDLDDSPKAQKRKIGEISEDGEAKAPPKKIVLNRNNSSNCEVAEHKDSKVESSTNEEKKIIKLSQLSAKERLEMRAKKFGVSSIGPDAKKAVRAERFGSVKNGSANSITSTKVETSVDVLKQRAERFGGSVSTVMSSLQNKEKLEKRKERFGSVTTTTTTTTTTADKAQQRLERFGQPVK